MSERTHQPKGRMCLKCAASLSLDCANLPFEQMPVIGETDEGIKIVRCTEHVPVRMNRD